MSDCGSADHASTSQRVAHFIGRDLSPGELATYPDLDTFPTEVTDLVAVLVMNHCSITAGRYLYERVPGCDRSEIKRRTELLTEAWVERWLPDDERQLRAVLGRELTPAETVTFQGEMPAAVRAVIVQLAARDFTLACKYLLQRRVPGIYLWGAMTWVNELQATIDSHLPDDADVTLRR